MSAGATSGVSAALDAESNSASGQPLVTVVMTCFNHGKYLPEAIASIRAQTWPHIEMILVDDGSTDDTAEIAAHFPDVQYIYQENQGPSGARNTAIAAAKGELIAFLDADDLFYPDGIEAGVRSLAENPTCAFTYGRNRRVMMDGRILLEDAVHPMDTDVYATFLRRNIIGSHASILYRTAILRTVGGFDVTLRACEDHELYMRIVRQYPMCRHTTFVTDYRFHNTNSTRNAARMLGWYKQMDRMQRPFIVGNHRRIAALDIGTRVACEYYGVLAMKGIASGAIHGQVGQALRDTRTLIQEYPQAPLTAVRTLVNRGPAGVRRRLKRAAKAVGSARTMRTKQANRAQPNTAVELRQPVFPPLPKPRLEEQITRYLRRNADAIRGTIMELGNGSLSRPFRANAKRRLIINIREGRLPIGDNRNVGAVTATLRRSTRLQPESVDWLICADAREHGINLQHMPQIEAMLAPGGHAVLAGIDHFGEPTDNSHAIVQNVQTLCPMLQVEPQPPLVAAELIGLTQNTAAAQQRDASRVLVLRKDTPRIGTATVA